MLRNYIKLIFALAGIFLGPYLMVLAYSVKLGSPTINNILIVSGLIIASMSGLYLIIRILKKLIS